MDREQIKTEAHFDGKYLISASDEKLPTENVVMNPSNFLRLNGFPGILSMDGHSSGLSSVVRPNQGAHLVMLVDHAINPGG